MSTNYERVKKSINKRKETIREIKQSSPCSDCGKKYPYYVMDFDHREGSEKTMGVSLAILRMGKELLLKEIEKCDLVCANCHRERTHQRNKSL